MKNFLKSGRVVLVLNGRYAGRKGVIVKGYDSGTSQRPYPHAVIVGVDRYPRKITRSMNKAKVEKRSRIKPFVKALNMNHIFPTRFTVDFKLNKALITDENLKTRRKRCMIRAHLKEVMEKKFRLGENKFFFTKLRF
ncbi:hypothetical protein HZS_4540 [Henneguya salminicola]|uniref:Large ribosomal subunit protein eL27 n=1 Tax=Henneguya salminicola TaxID=69463 RepID=A0A6G3ML09_HENSL|nr:hypothetical protein HZS_4540 [Henneguya salminicola]